MLSFFLYILCQRIKAVPKYNSTMTVNWKTRDSNLKFKNSLGEVRMKAKISNCFERVNRKFKFFSYLRNQRNNCAKY